MKQAAFSFLLFLTIALWSLSLNAQITGLWEITGVTVDDQSMTPIAKWTFIHEDGTYESGNGWLQNSKGTYTYDAESGNYLADDSLGFDDPYGSFSVKISGDKMTWQRMEAGKEVTLMLNRTNEKPMAPADKICGAWDLILAEIGERNITEDMDPNNEVSMLISWDKMFVSIEPDGNRTTGYWIIHAQRPELTLIHHNKEKADGHWTVSFNKDQMVWDEISDLETTMRLTFKRKNSIPKASKD